MHLKLFLEGFIIIEVDLMFDGAGTPKLIGFEHKGVMIGEE